MFGRPSNRQKLIIDYLYNLENTRMDPPDARISLRGIATALGLRAKEARKYLTELSDMAYVRPFRVGKDVYYTLTLFSMRELDSIRESSLETEVSTSRIGVSLHRKKRSPNDTGLRL